MICNTVAGFGILFTLLVTYMIALLTYFLKENNNV